MTKKCIICKEEANPISDRSFHMFPKNDLLRKKWIEALNLSTTPNFKTAYICSDHFDAKSFQYSDATRSRRRLCSESVPEKTNFNHFYLLRNVGNEPELENVANEPELDRHVDNLNNDSNSKKRKRLSTDNNEQIKKIRFIHNYKTERISREDFVSNEAWHRFLRYRNFTQSKIAAAQNKSSRKQKKINNINILITKLTEKAEFNAAEYLKDLPLHVKELLIRMKKRKPTAPFPENLKNFARALHFHSPAAYEFVRRNFLKCLPCVQTLNNWYCKKQYKPGISEETINNISNIVNQELEKGKKLVFNITFDEMHIKQHKEWDKTTHSWKGLVDLGGQLNEINKDGKYKVANKALVFMLVNINGGFKTPVAYYLINSLNGLEKSILLKDLLIKLNEKGINVVSVTFDGDKAHKTACEKLGANLNYKDKDNFKPYFEHPSGNLQPVYMFYDPCHCLKLIRNYFAKKRTIIYNRNEYIHWEFIKKLNKKQENEKLHCACKIRNRHVNFYNPGEN
ncbi:THAP domain-containing protein 9 [Camponotus japonicus]